MQPKPKVLVFTTAYYPFVGGAEIAIQEITKRLKDRFDFYVMTSRFRRDLPQREERPEGIIVRIGFGTRFDKYLLPFWRLTWTRRVQVNLDTPCPSAIVGVDLSHASVSAAVYKLFHPNTPFIFNIQFGEGEERLRSGRGGIISLMFRFILSQADYVTAISAYLLNLARSYGYDGPGEVIHNGVDVYKFKVKSEKLKVEHKEKIIITTSRLVQKNGIDILIRAMAEVKKIIPDVQCWIIGDGPEKESLEFEVKSLKLTESVRFFGSVPYEKIPEFLHKADVFVRPSRSEGMGNSFVEALAAGIPVIGTRVGGITDIIEDGKTGLFARSEDSPDLAKKIITLLNDKNLAASIVRNGQKMVGERFSWDRIAQTYARLFESYRGRTSIETIEVRPLYILIATPLFPPQLGGPALYAQNLGDEFKKAGHGVQIVSFGPFLRYPSIIRHLIYLWALFRRAFRSDIIFALDYTSVGLPAAVVSLLLGKPLVIRVEGDFLWESFVERTRKDVALPEFYRTHPPLTTKEKLIKKISGWVMNRAAHLVFSSAWRRKMVMHAYRTPEEKTVIIHNVFSHTLPLMPKAYGLNSKIILWAGRILYLKNLQQLLRVFAKVNDNTWQLHLVGEGPERKILELQVANLKLQEKVKFFGPLPHEKLLNKISESAFFVLPSLSEVGPNAIADSILSGTPFIMTRESGYAEFVKNVGVFVDPLNEKELEDGMRQLMSEDELKRRRANIAKFKLQRSWREAAEEWANFFIRIR